MLPHSADCMATQQRLITRSPVADVEPQTIPLRLIEPRRS